MNSHFLCWIAIACLVTSCDRQAEPQRATPPPIPSTAAPPAVRDTRLETYQLNERCAKDAHDWYKREWEDAHASNVFSSYTNHYNLKLDRCFLVVSSTLFGKEKKTGVDYSMTSKTLLNVLENRGVGSFDQSSKQTHPFQCDVDGTSCGSGDEWDSLAKPYMEN